MAGLTAPRLQAPSISRASVAWTIAIAEALLLAQAGGYWLWSNRWFTAEFAIPGSIAFALVGALIASRQPANRFGWLLLLMPLPGLIAFLCNEYSELVIFQHLSLPAEPYVAWVGNWIWTPSFGIGISMLTVRFPDGEVPPGWRFVDWIAFGGTAILAAAFAWITFPGSPAGLTAIQTSAIYLGLVVIALGAVAALASLAWRYRHGDRDLRLQMKWMLLATIVLTVSLVFAAVLEVAFSARFDWVLGPFYAALICVPIAIGVAILRHRLFDIDLIISRTLVYVIVTGILGGLYIGMIELMQQVSILYTGQRSETAIVLTAFVVAGAFRPVEKWTDGVVERRFRRGDVAARLQSVSSAAESVVRVIDPHGFAQWLVNESVASFEADGGVIYIYSHHRSRPFHSRGTIRSGAALEIPVSHEARELGRLVLGPRRGGIDYSHRDVEALKRSGVALGSALALASDLGHIAQSAAVIEVVSSDGDGGVPATGSPAVASERG